MPPEPVPIDAGMPPGEGFPPEPGRGIPPVAIESELDGLGISAGPPASGAPFVPSADAGMGMADSAGISPIVASDWLPLIRFFVMEVAPNA